MKEISCMTAKSISLTATTSGYIPTTNLPKVSGCGWTVRGGKGGKFGLGDVYSFISNRLASMQI